MLKLKFDSSQDFQLEAVQAITDIFQGQPARPLQFTVTKNGQGTLDGSFSELGYGNKLDLSDEDLLSNVIAIQDRHRLTRSTVLKDVEYDVPNFAVEMETGTGKTYVYLRTVYELNRQYGFTKFIIVVPSVAIREGVMKTLEITKDHFAGLYQGQHLDFFEYDSARLNKVRDFATASSIELMVINIDAFRKAFDDDEQGKSNVIHKPTDQLNGRKPIEFIQATRPIVIIDEPQSVDNTEKAKEAIKSLAPLCVLRYSATHRNTYNLMYKLGPVDAFERGLVKRIEVVGLESTGTGPYINLTSVSAKNGGYSAKIQIHVCDVDGVVRPKEFVVKPTKNNNLYDLSGRHDVYRDWVVSGMDATPGGEYVEFSNGEIVKMRQAAMDDAVKRAQIRDTIEAHLEKEARLIDRGIKVLSLFFIDRVANYRDYEGEESVKGKYAKMFEEEYLKFVRGSKFRNLFTSDAAKLYSLTEDVEKVHGAYFSIDKKGHVKDSSEKRSTKDDESLYDLIMKDKERLLSLETPLRFIFSHSALREGWDNPNVFQICTLVESNDIMTKRQKIGRGLRLPVGQDGERVFDTNVNTLTVVANESYESFAENLQMEIECETGFRFGVVEERLFDSILIGTGPEAKPLGYVAASRLVSYLKSAKLLDRHGRATTDLKQAVANQKLELPSEFASIEQKVIEAIKSVTRRLPVADKKNARQVKLNKQVLLSPEFRELWERIKWKTVYRLDFDVEAVVQDCIEAIMHDMPEIKATPIVTKWVDLHYAKDGLTVGDSHKMREHVREQFEEKNLPNVLEYVERHTGLKKGTIARILVESRRLDECYINPQKYMEEAIKIINEKKRVRIVDNIKYERLGDTEFYAQEMFEPKELIGYIGANALPVSEDKSVYDLVIFDSEVEKAFAKRLDANEDVKVFVKLPPRFKIETPLGNYNPDWAVVLNKNGEEKLYFVLETKGSVSQMDLRRQEEAKIRCGEQHFAALGTNVGYGTVASFDDLHRLTVPKQQQAEQVGQS